MRYLSLPLVAATALLFDLPAHAGGEAKPSTEHWKTAPTLTASAPDIGNWWSAFHDDELSGLIAESLANYPGLQGVYARVNQARASLRATRAQWYPSLGVTTGGSRNQWSSNGVFGSFGGPTAGTIDPYAEFKAGAEFAYEIDIWGRVRSQVTAAKATEAAATADGYAKGLLLASEVARLYFALRSIDEERSILAEAVDLRLRALDLVKAKLAAGATNQLDRARADAELATAEAEAAALQGPRAQLENSLAVMLGKRASEFKMPVKLLPKTLPSVPTALPSELVSRRPDLVMAQSLVDASAAHTGATRKAFLPTVSLGASVGQESSRMTNFADRNSTAWSFGLKVSLPIFDGSLRRAKVDEAKAKQDEAESNYKESVLIAFQEVETQLSTLAGQATQAVAQERLQAAADSAATLARQRYSEGVSTYLDVVEAERTSLGAKRALAQLKGQRLTSMVQLVKALGGGWTADKTK
jgi:outer membrane protein, multidrug efflux system